MNLDTQSLRRPISTHEVSKKLFKSTQDQWKLEPPIHIRTREWEGPVPTNRWFGNLLCGEEHVPMFPVWTDPYSIKITTTEAPFGIEVCFPFQYRGFGPLGKNDATQFYLHAQINDACLSANEFRSPEGQPTFYVDSYDDLGVNISLRTECSRMQMYLASGMAFISTVFTDHTHPIFTTAHEIVGVNNLSGDSLTVGKIVSGRKFVIKLNNGQRWVLYALGGNLTFDVVNVRTLRCLHVFNGTLQMAMLPAEGEESLYDPYQGCVLSSTRLFIPDKFSYGFEFKVSRFCTNSKFLHFTLPHHYDVIDASCAKQLSSLQLPSTTRGMMRAFTSNVDANDHSIWRFLEPKEMLTRFDPPRRPSDDLSEKFELRKRLQEDIQNISPVGPEGSYYFNGKSAMKFALLGLVAKELSPSLLQEWRAQFHSNVLETLARNAYSFPLVYDMVYKGIVSSEGFKGNGKQADFGNTVYNDHHFHYSYWIAACAIAWHLRDPSVCSTEDTERWENLRVVVETLLRDVLNPSHEDKHFPAFRHFDWFGGHSFAHGVTPMPDGKDQESASEEANLYYATCLWGRATGNTSLEDLGELMFKVNIRSINRYFFIHQSDDVHPALFRPNKVTGIFFENKCDYTTWFGADQLYIHGIQMLPFTPATPLIRPLSFVKEEWDGVLKNLEAVVNRDCKSTWVSLLFCNYAAIDRAGALDRLRDCPLDNGLSRTWALYYAMTCGNEKC